MKKMYKRAEAFLLRLFVFFSLPFGVLAQAPNISYSGVAINYPPNVAITALTPTNTGGAVSGLTNNVTTLAGSGTAGATDATGAAASFNAPYGVATDAAGNVYVADYLNHKIRKITPAGVVTTLAGSGTAGSTDATGTAASFNNPFGVAVDAAGNIYVADRDNHKIRKITPAGVVTTFAGSGAQGSIDATGAAASFNTPSGVAVDAAGNVYVADFRNNKIRKITPAGVVTTLAGSGAQGSTDATGTAASFNTPFGIDVDAAGNIYVADYNNHKIRKITPAGVVTTLAGSGAQGSTDATGAAASFNTPSGVAADAAGNVYVADRGNHKIRKITSAGVVTTLAGSGALGSTDATGTAASFTYPVGVTVDAAGNMYVGDALNNKIRKIDLLGYSISPALPTGLSINASGVISGTPTVTAPSTTYTITATNASGSSSTTIRFSVIACNMTAGISRSNNNLTATPTGGIAPYTYRWNTQATTATLTNVALGTYSVTITDSIGCTATATFNRCQVSNTQNRTIRQGDSVVVNNRAYRTAGTFRDTIIRNGLCDSIVTTNLTVVTCNMTAGISRSNNNLTATPTGGIAPYTYRWNTQATTATLTNVALGTYSVTITDSIGCTATATFNRCQVSNTQNRTIRQGDSVVVNNRAYRTAGTFRDTIIRNGLCDSIVTTNLTVVTCNMTAGISRSNNNLTATPTGGIAPYTYRWNTQATTATLTNIALGTYSVTITDSIGCTATATLLFNSSKDLINQSFKVFPNPTTDNVYLQFSNPIIQGSVLTIYDVLGQVQKVVTIPQGTEQFEVNLSAFNKGVYLLKIDDKMVRVLKQ